RKLIQGASLLDSAPSDSSDDSGQVLATPPRRLGETAFGDFGGRSCCTFHSDPRSSSEHRPGYCLLPHLYQDNPTIPPRIQRVKHTKPKVGPFSGKLASLREIQCVIA